MFVGSAPVVLHSNQERMTSSTRGKPENAHRRSYTRYHIHLPVLFQEFRPTFGARRSRPHARRRQTSFLQNLLEKVQNDRQAELAHSRTHGRGVPFVSRLRQGDQIPERIRETSPVAQRSEAERLRRMRDDLLDEAQSEDALEDSHR
jgi:hypothetical protein